MAELRINDLHVEVAGKEIIRGFNLSVKQGEVHALMGPNGTGKSTLAYALMGHPRYVITQGDIALTVKVCLGFQQTSAHTWGCSWHFITRLPSPG